MKLNNLERRLCACYSYHQSIFYELSPMEVSVGVLLLFNFSDGIYTAIHICNDFFFLEKGFTELNNIQRCGIIDCILINIKFRGLT